MLRDRDRAVVRRPTAAAVAAVGGLALVALSCVVAAGGTVPAWERSVFRAVPPAGLSFPSGHALVAFAVATLLAPYLRRPWQLVAFGLALLVCFARVYLGAHNPLDVTAGAGARLVVGGGLTLLLGVRRRA